MIHLGDITKIHGCAVPPVDCIIGGSPCQDLSVAGTRAGFSGERSVLFLDQVRVTKEMRYRDRASGRTGEFIRPRYMVWENVPGAFSSNGGRDFQSVLTETVRVVEPEAPVVPMPKNGWPTSGCLMGNGWSISWRVLDAKFWGVPQRRRRIVLIADFGGATAPEILFIRKGLSGSAEPGAAAGKGTPSGAGKSSGNPGFCPQGGVNDRDYTAGFSWKAGARAQGIGFAEEQCPTLSAQRHDATVMDISHASDGIRDCGNIVPSLQARMGTGGNQVPLTFRENKFGDYRPDDCGSTCKRRDCNGATDLIVAAVDCRNGTENQTTNGTLQAKSTGGSSLNLQNVCRVNQLIRRLTPLECERLQGFPDGWTDIGPWTDSKGKLHKESSDSARYKALGNSIALPPWKWVLKRLCAQYERDATMASLFDGIGGFPLLWEQLNGKGSCLWTSEIEEFPIAVTKYHFGDG